MSSRPLSLPNQVARFGAIQTREAAYAEVLRSARQYAKSEASLLIQGESGTGKELMARAIHEASQRAKGPYVVLNCAAIPETLLHSELFGHRRGAFTGAESAREGAFLSAHGGTLFLDEIGDAPEPVQVALLRALEAQRIKPLGSEVERAIDVRVVAATSRVMTHLMRDSKFRVDLYFRLAGAVLALPPLRERRADFPLLAAEMLAQLSSPDASALSLSPGALQRLQAHDWPGNVREFANALTGAACQLGPQDGGRIEVEHLSFLDDAATSEAPSGVRQVPPREEPSQGLEYLLPEAERYAATSLLLLPVHSSRRKSRARERALLLVWQGQGREFTHEMKRRARRLLGPGWQERDSGQALRDVQALRRLEQEEKR